jgi:hypothetical protein
MRLLRRRLAGSALCPRERRVMTTKQRSIMSAFVSDRSDRAIHREWDAPRAPMRPLPPRPSCDAA